MIHELSVTRLDTADEVAEMAMQLVQRAAADAISFGSRFVLGLAGGSTPRVLYERMAARPEQLPWASTHIVFGDERCVPPDHPRSNYRMVQEALLDRLDPKVAAVLRMEGEAAPETAASEYQLRLQELFPRAPWPRIDLLLLGLGSDGHMASLFPGSPALDESERWVVHNDGPGNDPADRRLTLTLPVLRAARRIVFMVTGTAKSRVVAEAFAGAPHDAPYPVEALLPPTCPIDLLLDREAAAGISPASHAPGW